MAVEPYGGSSAQGRSAGRGHQHDLYVQVCAFAMLGIVTKEDTDGEMPQNRSKTVIPQKTFIKGPQIKKEGRKGNKRIQIRVP